MSRIQTKDSDFRLNPLSRLNIAGGTLPMVACGR